MRREPHAAAILNDRPAPHPQVEIRRCRLVDPDLVRRHHECAALDVLYEHRAEHGAHEHAAILQLVNVQRPAFALEVNLTGDEISEGEIPILLVGDPQILHQCGVPPAPEPESWQDRLDAGVWLVWRRRQGGRRILRWVLGGFALVPEGEGLLGAEIGGGEPVGGAEVGGGGEGGAELVGWEGVGGLGDEAVEVVDGRGGGGERGLRVVGGGAAGGEGGLGGELGGGEAGEEGRDGGVLGRGGGGGGGALGEALQHGQVLAVAGGGGGGGGFGVVGLRLHLGGGGGGGGWNRGRANRSGFATEKMV